MREENTVYVKNVDGSWEAFGSLEGRSFIINGYRTKYDAVHAAQKIFAVWNGVEEDMVLYPVREEK